LLTGGCKRAVGWVPSHVVDSKDHRLVLGRAVTAMTPEGKVTSANWLQMKADHHSGHNLRGVFVVDISSKAGIHSVNNLKE
jgi:hypothetical protein